MNVEIGTEAPIFLFWEYLFQIFGILYLQCASPYPHGLGAQLEKPRWGAEPRIEIGLILY
jgi:hypothetical protein